MQRILPFLLCLLSSLCAEKTEKEMVDRIRGHLRIRDIYSAVEEGKVYAAVCPSSEPIHIALAQALCAKGDEIEAFECAGSLLDLELTETVRRELVTSLGWGVLTKANESPLLTARLHALLGAAFTNDAKAIPLILKEMKGSNAFLRFLAVQLAASYGDHLFRKELLLLLQEEKIWFVRLEVIKALGMLKEKKARPIFDTILLDDKSSLEEKSAVALAIVHMYETITREELLQLTGSNRAGLRLLGSEIIGHLNLRQEIDLLIPLLQDPLSSVRISTMNTLALLGVREIQERPIIDLLKENLSHVVPEISITAGWAALVLGNSVGEKILEKWMLEDNICLKRLATAALAASGEYGTSLAKKVLSKEKDLCAKVNLALGLIGQRENISEALDVILEALLETRGKLFAWMKETNPLFNALTLASSSTGDDGFLPEMVADQLIRIRLLSILTTLDHPKAIESVKNFLQNTRFSAFSLSSLFLLEGEGDSLLDFFQKLLEDKEERTRLLAALVLAIGKRDKQVIPILKEAYPKAGKEMKVYILDALARISDTDLIPFFIEGLKEPSQVIRVLAASAIIQSLYH